MNEMTKPQNWIPVTIGGITGIVLGAGSTYAAMTMAAPTAELQDENEIATNAPTHSATSSHSFAHAFATARAADGPGGTFIWRGNLYSTYTAEEWEAMSTAERQAFAERVNPSHSTDAAAQTDVAVVDDSATATEATEDAKVKTDDSDVTVVGRDDVAVATPASSWNDIVDDSNDVRIIGYREMQTAAGNNVTLQDLEINSQRVVVVDVDQDGEPDLALSDFNHNDLIDNGEVIDLHTGEVIAFTGDDTPDVDLPTI